nr:MAG TPA: hypothetical protein [Caudoviricetes sp.]
MLTFYHKVLDLVSIIQVNTLLRSYDHFLHHIMLF